MRRDHTHACSRENKTRNLVLPLQGKDRGRLWQWTFPQMGPHRGYWGPSTSVCNLTSMCGSISGSTHQPCQPSALPAHLHHLYVHSPMASSGSFQVMGGTLVAAASSMNPCGGPGATPEGSRLRSHWKGKLVCTPGRGFTHFSGTGTTISPHPRPYPGPFLIFL